jgi:guanyl-specific ribonuclease Sa
MVAHTKQPNHYPNAHLGDTTMNARQLFFGLLTATVVFTPFATLKPASATEQSNNQLIAQVLPGKKPVRKNSTGSAPQLNPKTISKDNLNHRAKATVNNVAGNRKPPVDPRKQMQYKQDGKKFKNNERSLPANGKYTEHTVPPKSGSNRGAERIVKNKNTGEQHHTNDHYKTFKKVNGQNRRNSH